MRGYLPNIDPMDHSNQQTKDLEQELIEHCTCDGPWGRQGCPVHGKHTRDKTKNGLSETWQIDESEFLIN